MRKTIWCYRLCSLNYVPTGLNRIEIFIKYPIIKLFTKDFGRLIMKILKQHTRMVTFLLTVLFTSVFLTETGFYEKTEVRIKEKIFSTSSPKAPFELKKARIEYYFNMLRDPKTNQIPPNIRAKELAFAKTLPAKKGLNKIAGANFIWNEAGPNDVGGRTRALDIDISNPNIIIAGGASGGIWKSTDNGATWEMKTLPTQIYSITSIAQDKRAGHTNTWYAVSGEYNGATASDRGYRAFYSGNGIYKSTDNGETWNLIAGTSSNPTKWDSYFDWVSKVVVSPTTGTVFIACNGIGIMKSTNGGSSFGIAIGGVNDHYYSDVTVLPDGTVIAVLSQSGYNASPANQPGVYKSTNDGLTWTNITPNTFPATHERSVLGAANNILYVLTNTGNTTGSGDEDIRLHKIDLSDNSSVELTSNLPAFAGTGGKMDSQSNYNLVVAVKPDDPNFVLIGGTSLFRSTDGFSTQLNDAKTDWIGGYHASEFFYPNHHPDQHVLVFDPSDPNKLWSGHDGGLNYTTDITTTAYSDYFPWISKNNGYNVTQFYTVALAKYANDERIMGGTQDNGTPFFTFYNGQTSSSGDLSSGDGSYAYFGADYAYVSSQNGKVMRLTYKSSGEPYNPYTEGIGWSEITPNNASGQLFINPFVIDPNDENKMLYPSGTSLWRNNDLSSIPNFQNGTNTGWTQLTNISIPAGYNITAIAISQSNPQHLLYFGASSSSGAPKIYKLQNANTSTSSATDISISGSADGAYVHNIAINPENGNEILVVYSNYNITGLYHSTDGGSSYTAVEGNLLGNASNPGPSLRSATILPVGSETVYIVGTSTGLYSTTFLNGASTVWVRENENGIGTAVVEYVTSRTSDYKVAAGTHGRGVFTGDLDGTVGINNLNYISNFILHQNYPNPFNPATTIKYTIPENDGGAPLDVKLAVYDVLGREITTLINEKQRAGSYEATFNAGSRDGLPSGIYFYKLTAGNFSQTKKMILMK